jgi:hypothetical protein
MKLKRKQSGLSLMEEVVVVATIALLIVIGLPAVRALFKSLESEGGAKAMISGALSTARAIAARQQHYAGVRFQYAYYKDDPANSPLKAPQYMIFIIHDFDKTGLANGFRAVDGFEPIKLPDSVGVMDLKLGSTDPDKIVDGDDKINDDWEVTDTTTFSIVFSPSGKLVIHDVQVRNRDGEPTATTSKDDIFNVKSNVENGIGMFVQDDYPGDGFDKEPSRNSFIIYERDKFEETYKKGRAWTDYLKNMAPQEIYINPYTGTMIEK